MITGTSAALQTSFTVMVSKAPYDSRNAESALKFCWSALNKGHKIEQVFFYRSGVHCASNLITPPSDETNIHKEWLKLYNRFGVKLNVCNTAANRRGIVNVESSLQDVFNVKEPFVMTGLSDYFSALYSGSKNIQF